MVITQIGRGLLLSAALLGAPKVAFAEGPIRGAGASLPAPVYAAWTKGYPAPAGVAIEYQASGSAAGLASVRAGQVDFGGSDMPLSLGELSHTRLVQFPTVIGGLSVVLNLKGIEPGALKLTGKVLGDIYLGKIKLWNDPAIAGLNPGLELPDDPIRPAHRAEGSGSTFVFTSYLSRVHPEWKKAVGAANKVTWPVGEERPGGDGVARYVKTGHGTIGYVEARMAAQLGLSHAALANRSGAFVQPTPRAFAAAAVNADWLNTPAFAVVLVDQPGAESWPLTTASFALLPSQPSDGARAAELLKFFSWGFRNGVKVTEEAGFVALPPSLLAIVEAGWARQMKGRDGKPVWTPATSR